MFLQLYYLKKNSVVALVKIRNAYNVIPELRNFLHRLHQFTKIGYNYTSIFSTISRHEGHFEILQLTKHTLINIAALKNEIPHEEISSKNSLVPICRCAPL